MFEKKLETKNPSILLIAAIFRIFELLDIGLRSLS